MVRPTVVVAFGDSITQATHQPEEARWVRRLEVSIEREFSGKEFAFVNSGVGGNTSREGLARIETDVVRHGPDVVIVQFGGNDATSDASRHVALDEFSANLLAMRERIAGECGARMLLVTFPPVVDAWHAHGRIEFYAPWGGLDRCVERYRQKTREFAREHAVPLADAYAGLRLRIERDGAARHILPDGVHLTADGNAAVAEIVFPFLVESLRRGR